MINYIKLAIMGIPAVIAGFLYFQNSSLQEKVTELNSTLNIEQENNRILKQNIDTIKGVNSANIQTIEILKKDNALSKKIVADLNQRTVSDTNLIDYLIKNVDRKDDKPATPALKSAVLSTKEKTK